MSNTNNWIKSFFGNYFNFFLAIITSVPLWLISSTYVNSIHVHEDEAMATGITFSFIAAIFLGRFLSIFWYNTIKNIPKLPLFGLSTFIVILFIWLIIHFIFPLQNTSHSTSSINLLLFWVPFIFINLALGILIKMFRTAAHNQLHDAQTLAANSQSELKLLQSQLSPHFLFNTLNNMYGLSITQHEKIPPLLLKLSELLRYSVYEANEVFVPLKDELAYIENYIEFEKIRIGERLILKTDFEEMTNTDIKIAPMLLIVFIENAFKHSKNTTDEQIFIDISLKTWGNSVLFSVKNSQNKTIQNNRILDKNSGFGLANVQKRLELLYNNKYLLEIQDEDDFYNIMLQLKIK